MKEIDSNRDAWSRISEKHYQTFKAALEKGGYLLNSHIQKELGDISGKKLIHLQCNTGADTIALARMGAKTVTGVDLVPQNILFARRLAADFSVSNVQFVESDIMQLAQIHKDTYDIVFTSEGVLGWLPDLNVWAKTIRSLLKEEGVLDVYDSHPFFLSFDEGKLAAETYEIKYPYFGKEPDIDDSIGGYACEPEKGVKCYFWMHTISSIINALSSAGMHIEFFNEFPENFFNSGGMAPIPETGLYRYAYNADKYPMSFSLRASVYR